MSGIVAIWKRDAKERQDTTRNTQRSYHEKYKSAQAIYENFPDDLHSEAAKKVHRELRDLNLPTLNDIKDEFEQMTNELGVRH